MFCLLVSLPVTISADELSPVSCDAVSADLRTLIKDLASQAQVNILVDDSIQKRITIRLDNVPFRQAMAILAGSFGLEVKEDGGAFIVLPSQDAGRITIGGAGGAGQQDVDASFILEAQALDPESLTSLVKSLGPHLNATPFPDLGVVVVTGPYSEVNSARTALSAWSSRLGQGAVDQAVQVVKLNHLDVSDAIAGLSGLFQGVRITGVRNTSHVVVSGRAADVEKAVEALRSLDVPPKVVAIEVQVVEVSARDSSHLGVGWRGPSGEPGLVIGWKEAEPQPGQGLGGGGGSTGLQIDFRPWVRTSLSLVTDINLMVESGQAKVLARPTITTIENRTARIVTGDRYAIVLTYGQGSSTWQQIQYIDAGIQLEITPKVDEHGNITAAIDPEVSAVAGFSKEGYPRIATREVHTTIRVKDGETIAIGGLMEVVSSTMV